MKIEQKLKAEQAEEEEENSESSENEEDSEEDSDDEEGDENGEFVYILIKSAVCLQFLLLSVPSNRNILACLRNFQTLSSSFGFWRIIKFARK